MKDLGKKTVSGLIYKFAERFSVQLVNFYISIVLARILAPEEFGTIALVTILITILDVFVNYGFGNSLIVNKKSDDLDFSTCFWFGLFLAIFFYIIIFVSAPLIAEHYSTPILTPIIRIMALRMPLSAINTVQHAYVSKQMLFKKFFISTSIGTVISGVLALIMAYTGYGIWALVIQYLSNIFLDTIFLSIIVKWRPYLMFSWSRLKIIYDYGWKILGVGLLDTIYNQLSSFVIADRYSRADLAYYTKGVHFPGAGMYAIIPTIDSVVFPALSNCNDDLARMKYMTRVLIKSATFITMPILIMLIAVAEPLVLSLLTEKWTNSIIFVQIASLSLLLRPVQTINNNVIRASGKSGMLLKLDIIKKGVGIVLILFSIPFGVKAIALCSVFVNYFSTFVNIWPNRKILRYGYKEQFNDIIPNLIISSIMGVCIWLFIYLPFTDTIKLIIQLIAGMFIYWFLAVAFKLEAYKLLKKQLFSYIKNSRN